MDRLLENWLEETLGNGDALVEVPRASLRAAIYRVARISMAPFELKIENASTAASTSQPISKSSSLYSPNILRIIAPLSSTTDISSRIFLRSETEIRMGPDGIGNRLCRSHLVYKMHLGVVVNTSRLIYRRLVVSVKTTLSSRRKPNGQTIGELVGRDDRRWRCHGRGAEGEAEGSVLRCNRKLQGTCLDPVPDEPDVNQKKITYPTTAIIIRNINILPKLCSDSPEVFPIFGC